VTTFQACVHGLRCLDALRKLCLRQTGPRAGFDQERGDVEFPLQCIVSGSILRVLHPLLMQIADLRHCFTSRARSRASLISLRGDFWAFFTKTRRATEIERVAG
jgi:hypothetical protein